MSVSRFSNTADDGIAAASMWNRVVAWIKSGLFATAASWVRQAFVKE
jgi:hypothetical protein